MPREKLPPITYSDAILNIDWNENLSLDENRARVIELTSSIRTITEHTTALVGVQQFVLGHSGNQSTNQAQIYFRCSDAHNLEKAKYWCERALKNGCEEAKDVIATINKELSEAKA